MWRADFWDFSGTEQNVFNKLSSTKIFDLANYMALNVNHDHTSYFTLVKYIRLLKMAAFSYEHLTMLNIF